MALSRRWKVLVDELAVEPVIPVICVPAADGAYPPMLASDFERLNALLGPGPPPNELAPPSEAPYTDMFVKAGWLQKGGRAVGKAQQYFNLISAPESDPMCTTILESEKFARNKPLTWPFQNGSSRDFKKTKNQYSRPSRVVTSGLTSG